LDELKSRQPTLRASIQELESGLAKVKLANSVGCAPTQLMTIQVDCPKDKIGNIIGKQGSMLQQIMDKHKVAIDVDKETLMAVITGSEIAVNNAKAVIEAIVKSVDVELSLRPDVVTYLTAAHTDVLAVLKSKYDDIHLDLSRKADKAILRGAPDRVEEAKAEILALNVTSQDLNLVGREFNHLLGPKGATIDRLVQEFKVAIDATKSKTEDSGNAIITGPPTQVESCIEAIRELLDTNREVTEVIEIDPVLKQILLSESGKIVKDLQQKVNAALRAEDDTANCHLSFPKDRSASPDLLVKAKQSIIDSAVALTNNGMKEYNELIITRNIDPLIVPQLIGKGGETVKELTHGKPLFLEIDRGSGKVVVGATSVEGRDFLLAKVDQIIDDNTIVRVPGDPELMIAQYRELMKSKARTPLQELARVDVDETAKVFVLRGKRENMERAKAILDEFVANNCLDEIAVLDEDFDALLSGGKGSKIMSFSQELEVSLSADRGRHIVAIRGPPAKVSNAKKTLDDFLNGGNGLGVAKLSVTNEVVGAIVGKGGKTRKDLEMKFGVSVQISREHKISIRGPSVGVGNCRVEILKIVASARISQEVALTNEQKASLEKNDTWRRISQQTSCQIVMEETKVVIRGGFYDVRDAVSLLNEQLTGEYRSSIELGSAQYTRLCATCRDPSHLQRIEIATDTKISLNSGRLEVSGKRSNVKKAKLQLYDFIGFVCAGELERLNITKPLFTTVGSGSALADVLANTGVSIIFLDRDLSCIVILDSTSDSVRTAARMIREKIQDAERLAYVMQIAPEEAWLAAYIIGHNGARIQSLQKGSGCQIDVSKETRTITITGTSEDDVVAVRGKLEALVDKGRHENIFMKIPEKAIPAFAGRGNQNLKDWSQEYGVDIQRVRGSTQFKIVGDESKNASFRKYADDWLTKWEASQGIVEMKIGKYQVAVVLGAKGSTAQAIEKEFGCRLDVDRKELTVTIRGGDEAKRQGAQSRIREILADDAALHAAATAERKEKADAQAAVAEAPAVVEDLSAPIPAETATKDPIAAPVKPRVLPHMQQPPQKQNSKKIPPKPNAAVVAGTEQGRDLFNLLIS
jgi:polyribonucleotide nucleotidyltransferase